MLSTLVKRGIPTASRAALSTPNVIAYSWSRVRSVSSSTQHPPEPPLKPRFIQSSADTINPETSLRQGWPGQQDQLWKFILPLGQKAYRLSNASPEESWAERENVIVKNLPKPRNAYSGRSVPIHGHEVGSAFTKLRRILMNNNVVKELRMAERHEKKGDKRRRLRSERWRRRFAHEVRKKVQLVNEIRARGS